MRAYHLGVLGATREGKSFFANKLHMEFPGLSLYFNPNDDRQIWGLKVRHVGELRPAVKRGETKFNYVPPRDRELAVAELIKLQEWLFAWGEGQQDEEPWAQFVIDEGHEFSRDSMQVDPIRSVATRGRHYGVRLVVLSQYPKPLSPTTRTNLSALVIFKPGVEGLQFLAKKGYDAETIRQWTNRRYHYAVYYGSADKPELRTPVPP